MRPPQLIRRVLHALFGWYEPAPIIPPREVVNGKLTFGDNEVGLLVQDFRMEPYGDRRGFSNVEFGRLVGPRPVLYAFFQKYSDVTKAATNSFRFEPTQPEGREPIEFDYAVITSVGVSVDSVGMIVCDRVSIMARERAAEPQVT